MKKEKIDGVDSRFVEAQNNLNLNSMAINNHESIDIEKIKSSLLGTCLEV